MKFPSIGIFGIITWFLAQITIEQPTTEPIALAYLTPIDVPIHPQFVLPITLSLVVIIIGWL